MANNIQIGADTSGFVSGVNRATESMRGLGGAIRGATNSSLFQGILSGMQGMLAGVGVFAALKSAATQFYSALEAGGALVDLAGQTGVAVDKLMVLQMAFDQAGLGASQVQPVLNKMQKVITDAASGSEEAAGKLQYLGLSAEQLAGMTADKQLEKIGDKLAEIKNPAERSAAAMEIFGRGGAKMLSYFASGGLEGVQENLGKQAALMLENAGIFDKISDVLGTAGSKVQGFFVGVAAEVVPQIMDVVDSLNGIDLTGIGQAFGEALSFWINYFRNFGTQGQLIGNTLALAFMDSVNSLNESLQMAWGEAYIGLKLAFANAINFLSTEMAVMFATFAAKVKALFKGENAEQASAAAEKEVRSRGPLINTDAMEKEKEMQKYKVVNPLFDTSERMAAVERDTKIIEDSKQANKEKALKENPTPDEGDGFGGILKKKTSTGAAVGLPDVSSLQKVGGGSGLLSGAQDNSPAYQSVRIQEDIRDYMKTLIDVVKQGGQDFQIAPSQSGSMVLTA
jgi:hypothetical protein